MKLCNRVVLIAIVVLLSQVCFGDDTERAAESKKAKKASSASCCGQDSKAQDSKAQDLIPLVPGKMCPMYLYGQWNGVFYYYGLTCPVGASPCNPIGASSMVLHSMDGPCVPCPNAGTCPDPITGIPTFLDPRIHDPHEPEQGVKILNFVPAKNLQPPPVGSSESEVVEWRRGQFCLAGPHVHVAYDDEAYVDIGDIGEGTRHVFRVIEAELNVQAAEQVTVRHVLRVGQELSRHDAGDPDAAVGRLKAVVDWPQNPQTATIIQIKILDEPLKDRYFTVIKRF